MIPCTDGITILKQLRERHLCDGTPIIAVTGNTVSSARESYLKESGLPIEVSLTTGGCIEFNNTQFGDKTSIKLNLDQTPDSHMVYDLFYDSALQKLQPTRSASAYTSAIFTGYKPVAGSVYIPDGIRLDRGSK